MVLICATTCVNELLTTALYFQFGRVSITLRYAIFFFFFLVFCHAFSLLNVARMFDKTGHCLSISTGYTRDLSFILSWLIMIWVTYKLNLETEGFLQVIFLHGLMRKPVEWYYVVNLNCCLSLFQKSKDTSHSIGSLWRNNKIRIQTKYFDIIYINKGNEENHSFLLNNITSRGT